MCFPKPKMPEPTAEELQAEAELKSLRRAQESALQQEKTEAKRKRTEEAIAKMKGRYGFSSLLSRAGARGFIPNYGKTSLIPNYGDTSTPSSSASSQRVFRRSGSPRIRKAAVPAARQARASILEAKGK